MTSSNFNNPLVIRKLYTDDFSNLLDIGPLRGGYRLIKHPDLIGYGIANEAGQVAFWDANGKPFLSYTDLNRWLDEHCPAAKTKPLAPVTDELAEPVNGNDVHSQATSTRRSFLKQAAKAIGLAAIAPVLPAVAADDEPTFPPDNTDWGTDHPLDLYFRNKAIGEAIDPARAAIIDQWLEREETLVSLCWALGDALDEARHTRPEDVDPKPVIDAIDNLQRFVTDLASDLECHPSADLVEAVTGRYEGAAWVERCIRNGDTWGDDCTDAENKARWLAEIEAMIEDHPEEQSKLMGAYLARFGGE